MGWKGCFKPTIWKVILFLILFVLSFYASTRIFMIGGGPSTFGYPFQFFQGSGCYIVPEADINNCWETKITSYLGLIGDIIIWYLIACLIILGYKKIRKKRLK